MAGFFDKIISDLHTDEVALLGPDYPYYKQIKTPTELGITADGGFDELAGDIAGLIDYIEVLVDGGGKASVTGLPLGDKFFIKTASTCSDPSNSDPSNNMVHRYIYVDNVPQGNIPFLSNLVDYDFSDFRGLIPGVISNLNVLNPVDIFKSFILGPSPPCRQLTMPVIDASNNQTIETHTVLDEDIKSMDPCSFVLDNVARPNPITGATCRGRGKESFQNINSNKYSDFSKMPNDILVQMYYISLALLALYLLLKLCKKTKFRL